MRVVLQRVSGASVTVAGETIAQIKQGYVLLVGVHQTDTEKDADYLVRKISKLRIFEDATGKMNQDLAAVQGQILSVSQFTLYADTKKGNRPSFTAAAAPDLAKQLYEYFNQALRMLNIEVQTGQFGAHMTVQLANDGPVTIIFESQQP